MRRPGLTPHENLHAAGLDSSTALGLVGDIEAYFGLAVDTAAAFEHPTIAALAGYLAERIEHSPEPADADPWLAPALGGRSRP